MTNELGRELTTAEHIAIATGETTIMDILHGVALEMDAARDAEVHTVMPSGVIITRGELWREMCATRANQQRSWPVAPGQSYVIGLNASSNMFA